MRRLLAAAISIIVVTVGIALASTSGDSSRPAPAAAATVSPPGSDADPALAQATVTQAGQQVGAYIAAVERDQFGAFLASIPPPAPSVPVEPVLSPAPGPGVNTSWPVSLQPCGGDLPPCYVKQRESGGDYSAANPSGACGAWQIMPGTWNGYGGYSSACDAPPAVQDAKARELWAGGAGCGHWSAC